ncbi:LINE-1 retrotransposable element ORF1 protein [Dissostichus eleginoides]|uniref:LINE-1 retrotransposable element ORF1 protein n=1 Tax=Dissostichus eleginoides TaxID=100907 RepID=A0AAD9CRF1_DISEL|nr:LINE-1 retrotransposable element ORF1 protein [Dissostichus eleginoides]
MGASQNEEHAANHAPLTLADMEKLFLSMEERIISKLSVQLSADRATVDRHDQTIQGMEVALNGMETRLQTVESTCTALSRENESLKFKVDDLENRSRRNNIRITGVPEKVEGPQPTAFMELFLAETFGAEAFPSPPAVDRAHRVTTARKTQSDTPRPFIAWIHNFQTKERILKLAREAGPLSFRGGNIHIFPDYSVEVSKKRATYAAVKSELRNAGLEYRMFFPAKLQVTDKNGQKLIFFSPGEVSSFLHSSRSGASSSQPIS